jgi:stearoyl-CoA desaturase (delta-9 desaturase)
MSDTKPTLLRRLFVTVVRWFDGYAVPTDENEPIRRVDWLRVVPFLAAHLACLAVIWVGWSPVAVGVAVALYVIRMFAITGFYHRYFSHRTFKTSRAAQFVFAFIGGSSAQRGAIWWASHHRHHHKHSDEETDPHSPRQHGFLWAHMLWFTSRANFAPRFKLVPDLMKYPELRFLDRFDIVAPVTLGAATWGLGKLLEVYAPSLGTNGPQMLVWGFFISTIVLFHGTCTINSLAHQIGRRRFETKDDSRNSWLLALITLGEGWHNNHHRYPGSVRQGFFWWELDLTYYGLKLLQALGIVWDLHPVPKHVTAPAERAAAGAPQT